MHVHMHSLRNEQCACAYDLNKQDGHQMVCMFDQVLDQTIDPCQLRAKEMKRGSSAGGLKIKALTQNARDAALSPAQCYTFHLYLIHSKRN